MAVIQASDIKIGSDIVLIDKTNFLRIEGVVMGVKTDTISKNLSLSAVLIAGIGWLDLANFENVEVY